ncbi:MAG TPA: hypothetical protein VHB77_06335, partial [Planctomycetaceae bacterium]|nr:hypothetical protein [Planctomycetaceae bacterium]
MATSRESELIAQAEAALRAADESAFLAPPRVVRRVIKQDSNVAGWGTHTPHRKSYVIPRGRLLPLVAHDELTLDPERPIPERVILLARPDDHDLSTLTLPELLLRLWRMLYHSRVHAAFDELLEAGRLTTAALRARIDRIGQVEFDEISSVLRQENYLLDPTSRAGVYVEFAAVYQELRHFAPSLLPTYFPSIDQFERIDEVLEADVDGTALFEQTRLQGALEPRRPEPEAEPSTDPSPRILALPPAAGRASERAHARWLRRADGASLRGNSVRAAILRTIALRYASDEQLSGTAAAASLELERLLDRLRAALGFDEEDAGRWRGVLGALLANSSRGFWNADRRLLYDLQRVCTDYERDIYVVDLVEWALSFGRRPIKRPLPTQREVLMSKHLHRAAARIPSVRLTDAERRRLAELLLAGTRSAS